MNYKNKKKIKSINIIFIFINGNYNNLFKSLYKFNNYNNNFYQYKYIFVLIIYNN